MTRRPFFKTTPIAAMALLVAGAWLPVCAHAQETAIQHVQVSAGGPQQQSGYDGVIEAVRQTILAGQVAGAIVGLDVKVGDSVKPGQLIARIDARAAEQSAVASEAQVVASRAAQELAKKDVERQRQLFQKGYISEAALERAEAQFKSTQAQVNAQLAQAGTARAQSGFFTVRAPYAGTISEVPVSLGDMALPGRPIATLYDPGALRVSASVPQSALPSSLTPGDVMVEVTDSTGTAVRIKPTRVTVLPTVDPSSHTVTLRLDLPAQRDLRPGMFARAWIPGVNNTGARRIAVPTSAIFRRAELTAVYVLGPENQPLLRQVRLGRTTGDEVEVLAGVSAGDRVVTNPQVAARVSGTGK